MRLARLRWLPLWTIGLSGFDRKVVRGIVYPRFTTRPLLVMSAQVAPISLPTA